VGGHRDAGTPAAPTAAARWRCGPAPAGGWAPASGELPTPPPSRLACPATPGAPGGRWSPRRGGRPGRHRWPPANPRQRCRGRPRSPTVGPCARHAVRTGAPIAVRGGGRWVLAGRRPWPRRAAGPRGRLLCTVRSTPARRLPRPREAGAWGSAARWPPAEAWLNAAAVAAGVYPRGPMPRPRTSVGRDPGAGRPRRGVSSARPYAGSGRRHRVRTAPRRWGPHAQTRRERASGVRGPMTAHRAPRNSPGVARQAVRAPSGCLWRYRTTKGGRPGHTARHVGPGMRQVVPPPRRTRRAGAWRGRHPPRCPGVWGWRCKPRARRNASPQAPQAWPSPRRGAEGAAWCQATVLGRVSQVWRGVGRLGPPAVRWLGLLLTQRDLHSGRSWERSCVGGPWPCRARARRG
jgi:hypothetical protein